MDNEGAKTALGILLIVTGLMTIVGGLSGQLAPMLGALFDPADLRDKSGSPPKDKSITSSILGNPLIDPLSGLLNPTGNFKQIYGFVTDPVGALKKLIP